jgi:hypothetical protein
MTLKKLHIIFIILCLISVKSYAQIRIGSLHYRNDTLQPVFTYNSTEKINTFHSSVKPYIVNDHQLLYQSKYTISKLQKGIPVFSPSQFYKYRLYPLANLTTGFDNASKFTYNAGIGLGMDFSKGNFFITGKYLPYLNKADYITDSIITFSGIYPSSGRPLAQNVYQNSELMLAYKANKFFTFLGGYGKNFFGDGYRSLLLSDNAPAYPFFKIETSFSSIKYVNLYQIWRDIYEPLDALKKPKLKYAATHYLSWNITNDFNFSIFETVVIGGNDTLSKRSLDLNYLNPVVFYRPVEYGLGSSDNVLLGLNMSYKTAHKQIIYYQLILDEFLLKELKAKSKWWANKYGMQFGFKAKDFLINNLYFQTEFNFVRPFTYSHKHSAQNYGQMNAPVAHPIGANFYEILNILSYQKNKHRITNKITYSGYGLDTSNVNYGQNIFHSYSDRDGEYGHQIMQGLKTNVFNNHLIYEYSIAPKIDLYLTAQYRYRFQINSNGINQNHYVMLGLKSRIWNKYTDF